MPFYRPDNFTLKGKNTYMYAIKTKQLTHQFSNGELALDQINLQVPQGSIYGFLGPNGAGKTTTLKLILGLLKKQKGEVFFFDESFAENRIKILEKTGSLIESPSIYTQLTASENLEVFRKIYRVPKPNIEQVLKIVSLSNTGKKRAGNFSLGMKQRLSIAISLLHNPSLLILDEPTNGLDPNGMVEIRELLVKLNKETGITILVSSHLLAEIEKMASHIGIINKGKLVFEGTMQALQEKQQLSEALKIKTNNDLLAQQLIEQMGFAVTIRNNQLLVTTLQPEDNATICVTLVKADIKVFEMTTQTNDLESIFMNLINH